MDETLRAALDDACRELVGKVVWTARNGVGCRVQFGLGESHYDGTDEISPYFLWLRGIGWELSKDGVVLATDADSRDVMVRGIERLVDVAITRFEMDLPGAGFVLGAENGLRLAALPGDDPDLNEWICFLPGERYFGVECGQLRHRLDSPPAGESEALT